LLSSLKKSSKKVQKTVDSLWAICESRHAHGIKTVKL